MIIASVGTVPLCFEIRLSYYFSLLSFLPKIHIMEYFDFDEAAQQDDLDLASNSLEIGDLSDLDFDTSNWDGIGELDFDTVNCSDANDVLAIPATTTQPIGEKEESVDRPLSNGPCPMKRAEEPCYFCRAFRLDCFVSDGGAMKNGCTCCISLYRECSFNHALPQGKFIDTLHVVSEDAYVPTGSLTGKKVLKSHGGITSGVRRLEELEQKGRKTGARFSHKAVKILKSWLSEHSSHPYPTDDEKDTLRIKTGLEKNQVSSWLANARRRGKARPRGVSPSRGAVPIPGKQLPPGVDYSELNPLERWRHSPPENEAASARDILTAMATTSFAPGSNNPKGGSHLRKSGSSNDDSQSNNRPAVSLNSYSLDTTTQSSISEMSFASAYSNRSSRGSWNSGDTKERRRRRQKSAIAQNSFQKHRGARIFQCTFCTDSFPTKYDWQRHEKSLHLPLDRWTCTPEGGVLRNPDGGFVCAFCQHPNPDEDHMETHNYSTCQEKPPQDRTFLRKDHLNQHLRLMHNVKYRPWMDAWKSATTEIKSRCGFCPATFTTWKDRVDHLAAHFKSGMEISQWKGGWGFDACIESAVEGGIPPYLIGHERNTLDPWVVPAPVSGSGHSGKKKAVSGASTSSSLSMPVPADANCFQRLETELSAYVGKSLGQGIVPTDKMIQSEARMIVYASDDAWNQTCADNPIWLAILKRDLGLCDPPEVTDVRLGDIGMQPPFAADGGLKQAPKDSATRVTSIANPPSAGSGFHSVQTSNRGSLSGSLSGSYDIFTPGDSASNSGGRDLFAPGNIQNYNRSPLSTSAPPAPIDANPLDAMGFEADFFQRFNQAQGGISQEINDMELENLKPADPMELTQNNAFSGLPFDFNDHNQKFNTASGPTSMSYPGIPVLSNNMPLGEAGPFESDYSNFFDPSSTAFDERMDYGAHSNRHFG